MSNYSILGLCGSFRAKSLNLAALKAAGEQMPAGMTMAIANFSDLPIYNQDVQDQGWPATLTRMRDAIAAADGLLIASPEYNWSLGAPLKNLIDWLSRLKDQPLPNKPIAILSATGGPVGGVRGQLDLRRILIGLGGQLLVKPEVFIGSAPGKFSPEGKLTDEVTRKFLTDQMIAYQDFIGRIKRVTA
ncbi:MAG: NAD(P)H-dependent oxidoreductase [Betaproteobacteria bacterium]|nr:NAD(P)H-dependent oxidoreductase [Betaproteobacteria bacterium]